MRAWSWLSFVLTVGCAGPSGVVPAVAMTSVTDRAAAEAELAAKVSTRVQHLKNGLFFLYVRPQLRFAVEAEPVMQPVEIVAREGDGFLGRAEVKRSAEELAELKKREVIHEEARFAANDLAKRFARAEREMFRDAVARAAKAQGRKEKALAGRIEFLDYTVADEGASVLLSAELAVTFAEAAKPGPASAPASQPASAPIKHTYEADEPID